MRTSKTPADDHAAVARVVDGADSPLPPNQQDGVLLPEVDRAPLQGPFAGGLALTEGSLMLPMPGLPPPMLGEP
jgi:hypothetical protein